MEVIGESLVSNGSIFEDKMNKVDKTLKHDSEESIFIFIRSFRKIYIVV